MFNPDLKRGSLELLILSAVQRQPLHGYEIGKLLELRSGGELALPVSTLYSILYRMEGKGWIQGRWVERPGERRRCTYRLTDDGAEVLARQQREWQAFSAMVNRVLEHAPA
jgi:DNA-binding PadR family transcriptional regulator